MASDPHAGCRASRSFNSKERWLFPPTEARSILYYNPRGCCPVVERSPPEPKPLSCASSGPWDPPGLAPPFPRQPLSGMQQSRRVSPRNSFFRTPTLGCLLLPLDVGRGLSCVDRSAGKVSVLRAEQQALGWEPKSRSGNALEQELVCRIQKPLALVLSGCEGSGPVVWVRVTCRDMAAWAPGAEPLHNAPAFSRGGTTPLRSCENRAPSPCPHLPLPLGDNMEKSQEGRLHFAQGWGELKVPQQGGAGQAAAPSSWQVLAWFTAGRPSARGSLASASGSEGCSWLGVHSPKGFLTLVAAGLLTCPQLACLFPCVPQVVPGPSSMRGYVSVQMGPPAPGGRERTSRWAAELEAEGTGREYTMQGARLEASLSGVHREA